MPAEVIWTAYGRPALDVLRDVVADLKQHDPLHPVTLVVPTNIAGIVARRHLARGLHPDRPAIAGLWITTLPGSPSTSPPRVSPDDLANGGS